MSLSVPFLFLIRGGIQMTLRSLQIFTVVFQTESFSRAADKLFVSQPVVSRAIKELEDYYGTPLFDRINQRIYATDAGKQLYSYALDIIDTVNQSKDIITNQGQTGTLRAGATASLGSLLIPKVLKEFQKTYPKVQVQTTVANGTKLQSLLKENMLDFALIEGLINDKYMSAEEFRTDRLLPILPPDSDLLPSDSISIKDLASHPLLLQEPGSTSRVYLDQIFSLHNMNPAPVMESYSIHAIIQGVHEGLGLSVLPEQLVRFYIQTGFVQTRPLKEDPMLRKNYIVRYKKKFVSPLSEYFIFLCRTLPIDSAE